MVHRRLFKNQRAVPCTRAHNSDTKWVVIAIMTVSLLRSGGAQNISRISRYIHQSLVTSIAPAVDIGPVNPKTRMTISIDFLPSNIPLMEAYANDVSNPKSPYYRKWLTPEQIGEKFGAPFATLREAESDLKQHGLTVTLVAKDRLHIIAKGSATQVERTFQTPIDRFRRIQIEKGIKTVFFANTRVPRLPFSFASKVQFVSGLDDASKPIPHILDVNQARKMYNLQPTYDLRDEGQGRTVGISSFDGFQLSNVRLLYSQYNLPTPVSGILGNVTIKTIDGGSEFSSAQGEGDLDMQMVLGEAPLCNLIVYDGNSSLVDVLTQEVNDNAADVITESYGWNFTTSEAIAAHTLHTEMTTEGITYCGASGDNGATIGPAYYPDDDPDVLMVGGTVASVDSNGLRISETGWSGSGGGWFPNNDPFNVLPSYQRGNGVPTNENYRLVPDVSMNASGVRNGGFYFYYQGSLDNSFSGTSFSSPVFAGGLAVAEQALISKGNLPPDNAGHQRLGRINDLIYQENGNPKIWYDITSGSNGQLPDGSTAFCTPGWDYVTGWGAINWQGFINSYPISSTIFVTPFAIGIDSNIGTNFVQQANALTSMDGVYDTVQSVSTISGNKVALAASFQLNSSSKLTKLAIIEGSQSTTSGQVSIYLYNNLKRKYDFETSFQNNATDTENSFVIPTFAPYVNSLGQVKAIFVEVQNAPLGRAFQLNLDEFKLGETF